MYDRIQEKPKNKSFFLFGPRGTGKTTWVKTSFPGAIYIDLLKDRLFTSLLAYPERLSELVPKNHQDWIVIDEVQKVPKLLNEVHRLIEDKQWKFILTGSNARKLRKKGINLLAGRALTYSFFPLTHQELGPDFSLEHSLKYGHLPSVYQEEDPQKYLESYVSTYLREEIREEGLTRNLANFSRFLEAASFSQGSVLNISEVARDCSVERRVVQNYFGILQDLLIADMLPVFSKKAKRRLISHAKFYFFDIGLYRAIRPSGPLDQPEEIEGICLESLLFQELKALNALKNLGYELFYWRTASGQEVDFVLYGPKGIFAFEVKRSQKISGKTLHGLHAFQKDYPQAKGYCAYLGQEKIYQQSVEVWPFEKLLEALPSILANSQPKQA